MQHPEIVLYFMKWNKDFNYTKYLHSEEDLLTGHSVSQPLTIHPVLTINTLCLKMQSSHLQWRTQSPRSQVCKAICLECQHLCWSKCGFVLVSQTTLKAPSCCICWEQKHSKFKQNWVSWAAFTNAPSTKYITSKQQYVRNIQMHNIALTDKSYFQCHCNVDMHNKHTSKDFLKQWA